MGRLSTTKCTYLPTSRCSGRLARPRGAFLHPSGPGFIGWLRGARGGGQRAGLIVPAARPRRSGGAGLALRRTRSGPAMRLSLAGPSDVGLGLRALRCFACVDPVTDASGFPYRLSFDRGLGGCTGAVSPGRQHLPLLVGGRHAWVPRVCVCARPSWPGRACRPPRHVLVRLAFHLAALSFCFARRPPGWGCPAAVPFFAFFLLALFPLRASVVFFFLWYPAPCALGLGALFPFSSLFFFLRARCLQFSLVSGGGCPGPWRCGSFVLLVSRMSALRPLLLLLCFPPYRWLFLGGCCPPPPPPVSRGLCPCPLVPPSFFSSAALLLPACLALVGGSRRPLPPPASCLF